MKISITLILAVICIVLLAQCYPEKQNISFDEEISKAMSAHKNKPSNKASSAQKKSPTAKPGSAKKASSQKLSSSPGLY